MIASCLNNNRIINVIKMTLLVLNCYITYCYMYSRSSTQCSQYDNAHLSAH